MKPNDAMTPKIVIVSSAPLVADKILALNSGGVKRQTISAFFAGGGKPAAVTVYFGGGPLLINQLSPWFHSGLGEPIQLPRW